MAQEWMPEMQEISVRLGDHEIQHCAFDQDVILIGRAKDNDIILNNLCVSRHHARIIRKNRKHYITDLDCAGGVAVNGFSSRHARIRNEDVISIGKHRLLFCIPDELNSGDSSVEALASANLSISPTRGKSAEYAIRMPLVTIGRSRRAKIRVTDWFMQDFEAIIARSDEGYTVRTLGSGAGEIPVVDGDILQFGITSAHISIRNQEMRKNMASPQANTSEVTNLPEPIFVADVDYFPADPMPEFAAANTVADELDFSLPDPEPSSGHVIFWQKALQNKSLAVRKHAALQLKKLTGRDYDS